MHFHLVQRIYYFLHFYGVCSMHCTVVVYFLNSCVLCMFFQYLRAYQNIYATRFAYPTNQSHQVGIPILLSVASPIPPVIRITDFDLRFWSSGPFCISWIHRTRDFQGRKRISIRLLGSIINSLVGPSACIIDLDPWSSERSLARVSCIVSFI